jgi:hypothetical protein
MFYLIFFIATSRPRHSPLNTSEELPYPIFSLKISAAKSMIYCYAFFFTYSTIKSLRSIKLSLFGDEFFKTAFSGTTTGTFDCPLW